MLAPGLRKDCLLAMNWKLGKVGGEMETGKGMGTFGSGMRGSD